MSILKGVMDRLGRDLGLAHAVLDLLMDTEAPDHAMLQDRRILRIAEHGYPTEEGWYWVSDPGRAAGHRLVVRRIEKAASGTQLEVVGNCLLDKFLDDGGKIFGGPIPRPEEEGL